MRKMGIGLGVGINRSNYAQGIFNAYSARVVADGGVVESGTCVDAGSSLLQSASLLLIPSGYKGGKLYAEIPTNGNGDLTWTRGSDAFRTNESGVIQRVPWNLVQYSEQFNDASWIKGNVTATANTITAPDGNLTADTITIQTTSGNNLRQNVTVTANTTYTFSFYALRGTATDLRYSVFNFSGGSDIVAITSYYSQTNSSTWSRISVTFTTPTGCTSIGVYPVRDVTSTGTFFIWGAQLVEGTTAQTYLPTTDRLNFPRLSYMYGSCPSALLEPQRTNLFVNSGWTGGGATPTNWLSFITGTTTPLTSIKNNSVTAYRFIGTSQRAFFIYGMSVTSGVSYSFSVYVESVTTTGDVSFMLSFANITGTATYYRNGVLITASTTIEAGYTYTMLFVPSVTTIGDFRIGMGAQGNATANYVLSMPQFEQGAYATTFILSPVSSTATRVADSFSRSNIYTNGLISASGGTWFVELRNNISYVRDGVARFGIGDTSAINLNSLHIGSLSSTTTRQQIYKTVAGSYFLLYTTLTDTVKIAIKWNGTSADVFVNGTKVVSATSFITTNMELLKDSGGLTAPTFIQQMALFPTPLSDTDCTTLTTL